MRSKFFTNYFLVTFLAVTLASGLIWLDSFREYRGEMTVLVIDKVSGGEATDNLVEISKNLSFYEGVLKRETALEDLAAGLSPDRRKASWQRMVSVKKEDGSGLLTVTAWAETKDRAHLLALATAHELFATASRYYNIKSDIDMRIVDGPVLTTGIRSYVSYVGASLFSGFVITSLFFLLLGLSDRVMTRRLVRISQPSQDLDREKMFTPTPPQWLGQEWTDKRVSQEYEDRKVDMSPPEKDNLPAIPTYEAKASAPSNLPVLEDTEGQELSPLAGALARLMKKDIDETTRKHVNEEESREAVLPRTEEPTADEYRRRLNALLSGTLK